MEHLHGEELERHVLYSEQVTVKQEVIDEDYRVALTDKEVVCNTDKCITDINDTTENKVDAHLLCNFDITVGKSELVTEPPVEYIKHESNTEEQQEAREEVEVKIDNENEVTKGQEYADTVALEEGSVKIEQAGNGIIDTGVNTTVSISLPDCKTEGETTFVKDEEVLYDSASIAHSELVKESTEKEDHSVLEKKGYTCKICKKTFIKKSSLSSHEMTHTGETPFKCQFCNKGFNVRSNLNVHLRIHTATTENTSESPVFDCDICESKFSSKGNLKRHLKKHESSAAAAICTVCGETFSRKDNLTRHYENVHKQDDTNTQHLCSKCGKMCKGKQDLINHARLHKAVLSCEVCNATFKRNDNLQRHLRKHKSLSQQCPYCNSYFMNLKKHLNEKCRRQSDFKCPCGKTFAAKRYLNEHNKRIHEKKMFACKLCQIMFNSRTSRKNHMKDAHASD